MINILSERFCKHQPLTLPFAHYFAHYLISKKKKKFNELPPYDIFKITKTTYNFPKENSYA